MVDNDWVVYFTVDKVGECDILESQRAFSFVGNQNKKQLVTARTFTYPVPPPVLELGSAEPPQTLIRAPFY